MVFFFIILGGVLCYLFGYFMGWLFASQKLDEDCKELRDKFDTIEDVMQREG